MAFKVLVIQTFGTVLCEIGCSSAAGVTFTRLISLLGLAHEDQFMHLWVV